MCVSWLYLVQSQQYVLRKATETINEIISCKPKNNKSINSLLINNKSITEPLEIANKLGSYFSEIGPTLANKIPSSTESA